MANQLDFFKGDIRQKLAEDEHKKFVDLMHPYFGLETKPDYVGNIYFRKMFLMGFLASNPWKIAINEDYSSEENRDKIIHTIWHESSHYLHHIKNPDFKVLNIPENETEEEHDERIYLVEGVGDLGSLIMLKETEGLNYNQARRYHMIRNKDFPNDRLDEEKMLTWVIAMRDHSLLEKIVSNNVPEAREIMNQHREEALIYVNSICRLGLEVSESDLHY